MVAATVYWESGFVLSRTQRTDCRVWKRADNDFGEYIYAASSIFSFPFPCCSTRKKDSCTTMQGVGVDVNSRTVEGRRGAMPNAKCQIAMLPNAKLANAKCQTSKSILYGNAKAKTTNEKQKTQPPHSL